MKMFLGEFRELTKDELLSVNGGEYGVPTNHLDNAIWDPINRCWYTGPSKTNASSNPSTSSSNPTASSSYPSASSSYPKTSSAYPATSSGYPSTSSAYPATFSGPGQATYPATTGATGTPGSWGQISDADAERIRMQDEMNNGKSNLMGNKELLSLKGCKMAAGAQLMTQITDGATVTLSEVNKTVDTNQDGKLGKDEIAAALNNRLTDAEVTTSILPADQISIDNIRDSLSKPGTHYLLAKAEGVAGGDHWIILEGSYTNDRGQIEFRYNASSTNDDTKSRHYIIGNPQQGQENFHKIIGLEIYTVN